METQKIANLLGGADKESSKLAIIKWFVINDQNNTDYGEGNENGTTAKFETQLIKSNLLWLFRRIYSCNRGYSKSRWWC